MPPGKTPETTPNLPGPKVHAVLFVNPVEIQGAGMLGSVNAVRLPGARVSLSDYGVTVTLFAGSQTLVPWHMVKAVHLE